MRISDWSSDVCSSDLDTVHQFKRHGAIPRKNRGMRGQASPPPVRGRFIFVGAQNGQDATGHAGVCRVWPTGIRMAVVIGDFPIPAGSPPIAGTAISPAARLVCFTEICVTAAHERKFVLSRGSEARTVLNYRKHSKKENT